MVLFADDTTVLLSHSNADILANLLNIELETIYVWLECNNLKINFDKTCTILFEPKIKTNLITFKIYFHTALIKKVSSTKFLGIIILSNLLLEA